MTDNTTFSIEKKRKLANKISEIRDKDDLRKIKKIIFSLNPNIAVNRDSGGMLMFFQNLTTETYINLENFLEEIKMRRLTKQAIRITKTSEKLHFDTEQFTGNNKVFITHSAHSDSAKNTFRYSNKEKSIIRKKEYEQIIRQSVSEQLDSTNSDEKKKKFIVSSKKNIFARNNI